MWPLFLRLRLQHVALGAVLALPAALAGQPVPQPPQPPLPPGPSPPQPYRQPPVFPVALLPCFVAIAAAAYLLQKRLEEEEEEVTPHLSDPTTAFEYKIIRSAGGAFQKPDKLRAMLDEEGRAGWELFELLDGCRARLRRPTACRARDGELTQDPYRTRYGSGEGAIALKIVLVIFGIIAVMVGTIAVVAAVSK
jgi:hypothetical protein